MQTVNAAYQAELDKGQADPRKLIDLVEFYDVDYEPGPDGFDPDDAIERFAAEEITWKGNAYRRELRGGEDGPLRSDVSKNMNEKVNSCTLFFSNISRYMATLAQSQMIEGLLCAIRCVSPTVEDDWIILHHGKAGKPSDIDKESFELEIRQDFGNINQSTPPRKFTGQDPEGRLPSDPLFEGINFIAITGSVTFPVIVPSTSFFGRLFGRRDTDYHTQQSSSMDGTPYGEVLPEVFGRCQMGLIPFLWKDQGLHIAFLMAISNGPIFGADNFKIRTPGWGPLINSFATPPAPPVVHLGLAGTANVIPTNFPSAGYFSHLAYLDANSVGSTFESIDTPPEVTAVVMGRVIPLPDSSGDYTEEGWSDNPVHILRFLLTDPSFVNINPAFMEDDAFVREAQHCDFPLIDESQDQVIRVVAEDVNDNSARRYTSTGIYNTQQIAFYELGTSSDAPELLDVPIDDWIPIDYDNPFVPVVYQRLLRKRYTFNAPITSEVRAVDFIYKTVNLTAKIFIRVNKRGKYEPVCEKPSDATYLRAATSVGATSILIQDVTPWKTGPNLLTGRLLLGFNVTTSEVRNVSTVTYTADGNAITLTVSKTGGVTISASGATLSGGSTTVQASGTITIGGTPAAGNTITATINGHPVQYTLTEDDDEETAAAMLSHHVNATVRLSKYILASWTSASPTVITITCLYGVLNLDTQLLKAHTGPVADPMTAPTIAAGSGALLAGVYKVVYADVGALGQTSITPIAPITLTASQKIDVSSLPAFPTGITSRNFYMSDEAGSSHLRFITTRTNASDFSITALPLPNASVPPSHNRTSDELIRVAMSFSTNSQDVLPVWPANTAVILNDVYLPTSPNGHKYQVTTAGTTGSTEPTWPTGAGATVASGPGTVVFTEIGATYLGQAGLTRANVKKGTFKWPLGSRQASVNQVKISYRSAKDDFALVPYRVNDPVHQEQVKKTYPLEVDGSAIDNFHQMYRIANWQLAKNREGDWFNSLGTGPQGLVLEEGDVICASDDSGGLVNVVTRIEDLRIHPNHDVSINQARKYSTNMFSDDVTADTIPLVSTLRFAGTANSHIEFIDTAPIRDSDGVVPGFYVAVSRDIVATGDWRGWALWVDFGDGYVRLVKGDLAATMGTATTVLGGPIDPDVYDVTNSVTFTVHWGAEPLNFVSATQAELDANPLRNLFLVGKEYIQAADITDNGSHSYTLSGGLKRGRFHSGGKMIHATPERVVYMNGAEVFVPMNSNRRTRPFNYKAVTTNQDRDDAAVHSFTWSGGTFRPAAPRNITVYRDAFELASTSAGQVQFSIPEIKNIHNETPRYAVDVYKATTSGTFTVDAGTDVFTTTSHGLTLVDTIALSTTGLLPAPLQKEDHYFLRDITTHTFKLARTEDGGAINLTDTGSGTHSFSKRLRHMPVIQGMINPVVVDNFDDTITTPGSGGLLETISSTYSPATFFAPQITSHNDLRNPVSIPSPNVRAFGEITESGFIAEFTLSTITREVAAQVYAMSLANPANAAALTNAYYQMHFTLETTGLPSKFASTARRWKLRIKEIESGSTPITVFTATGYEMPDTRYRIQISGSEIQYFRNYSAAGSQALYKSTIPVMLPLSLDAAITTTHATFIDVKAGGRQEYVTTYPAEDQIADTGANPPPVTFRYRVYEERTFQNVDYQGDATDFIT